MALPKKFGVKPKPKTTVGWAEGTHAGQVEQAATTVKPKYIPILSLPPEQLHKLNSVIFEDNKPSEAARMLKEDFGLYKTTKMDTLRIYVQAYKKEYKEAWHQFNMGGTMHISQAIPPELTEHMPKSVGDPTIAQWIPFGKIKVLLAQAMVKFDAMTELERVTLLQYDRVIKLIEYESKLPTSMKNKKGDDVPLLPLAEVGGREIATLHAMLRTLVGLQMDLGIRHKVEPASNHLHIDLNPQHQKLMTDFETMKTISNVTAEALELISKGRQPAVESDHGFDDEPLDDYGQ